MNNNGKTKLLLKIAEMYYLQNQSQQEISDNLGISRSQVSRFLTKAKSEGIVNIKINNPFSEKTSLEEKLCKKFNLRETILIDYPYVNEEDFYDVFSQEAQDLFSRVIKDGDTIAMASGKTLTLLSERIGNINKKDITIVPTGGCFSFKNSKWQSSVIISNFASAWKCTGLQLNVPSIVSKKETRDALLKEKDIIEPLNLSKKANVLITGLGFMGNTEGTIFSSNSISENDLKDLYRKNIKTSFCGSYIDINGKDVDCSCQSKSINLRINEFNKNTTFIAMAFGPQKLEPVVAGLRTGRINILITDIKNGKNVLEFDS